MRFIVDEMPTSANCDCPFAVWKPYPPCFEETGCYICKLDKKNATGMKLNADGGYKVTGNNGRADNGLDKPGSGD